MKYFVGFLLMAVIVCCQVRPGKKNNSLIGKWKLTEYYADIGDGKEHWQAAGASLMKTIEFKPNGAFVDSGLRKPGRYTLKDSTHINIVEGENGKSYTWTIISLKAKNLTVKPDCIEGCGEKYVKVP